MSQEINLVAIITPKVGKTDRVVELLTDVITHVKANEPGTLKYEMFRTSKNKKTGLEELVMVEKYASKDSLTTHGSSPTFQNFQKTLESEGLLEKPSALKMVRPAGGFARL